MYEPVYSTYCGKIGDGNRTLTVTIVPCFGTTYEIYNGDKIYWCVNSNIRKEEGDEEKEIFLPSATEWILETSSITENIYVYVTEYTKRIQTPIDDEMNNIINEKVKEAQREYRKRKKTEKRLYFYDAMNVRLSLYKDGGGFYDDKCRYPLNRPFTPYQALDKRYPEPKESCFILGRVRRTIGTKDGELMDFIEPIAEFEYEEEDDLFGNEKRRLGNCLFAMLRFSISKEEPTGVTAARIKNQMHCTVQEFLIQLDKALEAGDIENINFLSNVLYEQQDCSNAKFQIVEHSFEEKKELHVSSTDSIWIRYENEELGAKSAEWIAENICKCTNAKVSQQLLTEKYIFY